MVPVPFGSVGPKGHPPTEVGTEGTRVAQRTAVAMVVVTTVYVTSFVVVATTSTPAGISGPKSGITPGSVCRVAAVLVSLTAIDETDSIYGAIVRPTGPTAAADCAGRGLPIEGTGIGGRNGVGVRLASCPIKRTSAVCGGTGYVYLVEVAVPMLAGVVSDNSSAADGSARGII